MKVSSVHDQAMAAREALIVGASTDHTRRFLFVMETDPRRWTRFVELGLEAKGNEWRGFELIATARF